MSTCGAASRQTSLPGEAVLVRGSLYSTIPRRNGSGTVAGPSCDPPQPLLVNRGQEGYSLTMLFNEPTCLFFNGSTFIPLFHLPK